MARVLTKDDVVGVFSAASHSVYRFGGPRSSGIAPRGRPDGVPRRDRVCVGGSTGEGYALTAEELGQVVKTTAEEVRGRVPVMAGIISTSTREAVRKAMAAREAGAQALMVTPPVYQVVSEDGLVEYYSRIHAASGLPIVVYNVITSAPITPAMMRRLASEKSVALIGTKESIGGSLETLSELIETMSDKIAVTWAHDWLYYPGMALGAVGSISGMGAILPRHSIMLWNAIKDGDIPLCQALHFVMSGVSKEITKNNWPAGTKFAINAQGRKVGPSRSPFGPNTVPQEQKDRITAAVRRAEEFLQERKAA